MNSKKIKITVIGLGYVGLPLSVEFARYYDTVGYDINKKRINNLNNLIDDTNEIEIHKLKSVLVKNFNKKGLLLTTNQDHIKNSNFYVITVPTPIDLDKKPDLKPILSATSLVAKFIKKEDIVVFESTVYPGLTEEKCIPLIEEISGLKFNIDFFIGYSPERINPGDKKRTLTNIKKIVSGSNSKSTDIINSVYKKIIKAGTYVAPSIKIAEAAKVIENSQRDINIAFVNELSKIFNLMDIDTNEVLKAASTKWNFLPFKPGLVGGHCIGVDPYYLAQKSQELGYNPEIILSGRKLNDSMGSYVAENVMKLMLKKEIKIIDSEILVLGITFKENCPDCRNTKVIDIINSLKVHGIKLKVHDPCVSVDEVKKEFNIDCLKQIPNKKFDAIILAVSHKQFLKLEFKNYLKKISILYDVKGVLNGISDGSL